tara:strand:+ start:4321 stop:5499 length:1179 start_codon:yes stop_codon:yes gene_type:complete
VEQKKPRILVLLSRIPYPLDKGDKLRAYQQILGLSQEFRIVLVCLNTGIADPEAFKLLNPICENVHVIRLNRISIYWRLFLNVFKDKPYQIAYFYSKTAHKELDFIIEKYLPQRFYCQLIRVAEYAKKYSIFEKTLDYMDALSAGMERRVESAPLILKPMLNSEAKRLKKYEEDIFTSFEKKTIISKYDRDQIAHPNHAQIKIIPNGISENYFEKIEVEKEFDLCFTGNMSYPPNVKGANYLIKKILPLINVPENIQVLISGKSPSPLVKRLAKKNVTISGWVEDMRVSYAKSKIFVAPMIIGSGLQNKLLEAMAQGIPCITTSLANEALAAKPNKEILIANSPEEFSEHINRLLENPELRKEIGQSGQNYVKQNFSWKYWNDQLVEFVLEN